MDKGFYNKCITFGTCEMRLLNQMLNLSRIFDCNSIAVSSIAINTAIYAMIHMAFFYIPINFGFNLPHYVTSYMHHKGKNKSKKEKEKKGGKKNLLQGD